LTVSVSKILRDSITLSLDTLESIPLPSRETRDVNSDSDAGAFWVELNKTLDDFFSTITASKEHIKRLNDRLVESDNRIEFLTTENAVLREQLESRDSRPGSNAEPARSASPPPVPDVCVNTPPSGIPMEARARRSIWSRLSGLERGSTPTDDLNF
jgi:hypothetical protein